MRLGGASFRAEIDNLEHDCMDPDIEEHYRELMKQWKKDDDSIKDKLEEIGGKKNILRCQYGWIRRLQKYLFSANTAVEASS